MRYQHQTGGEMVAVDHSKPMKVGELVELGALIGVCATSAGTTQVLRVGGQVVGPVKASDELPAVPGTPVFLDKTGALTTSATGKSARAAGVLLSRGTHPRVLLRGIVA